MLDIIAISTFQALSDQLRKTFKGKCQDEQDYIDRKTTITTVDCFYPPYGMAKLLARGRSDPRPVWLQVCKGTVFNDNTCDTIDFEERNEKAIVPAAKKLLSNLKIPI